MGDWIEVFEDIEPVPWPTLTHRGREWGGGIGSVHKFEKETKFNAKGFGCRQTCITMRCGFQCYCKRIDCEAVHMVRALKNRPSLSVTKEDGSRQHKAKAIKRKNSKREQDVR